MLGVNGRGRLASLSTRPAGKACLQSQKENDTVVMRCNIDDWDFSPCLRTFS
jgi:hypothetical protein